MENSNSRRNAMKVMAGSAAAAMGLSLSNRVEAAEKQLVGLKGKINHSVCRWCYGSIPLEDFLKASKEMGISSIDLLSLEEIPMAKKHDLTCAMVMPTTKDWGITKGWNRTENHEKMIEFYTKTIDETSKLGMTNLIVFSGNREGMNDEKGMKNCAEGLKKLMSHAEKKKVTLVMELLNSKVDHKDYMCDHTKWGVDLAKMIGSERFKLLYDIYHMQIMEGDVIRNIKDYNPYIAHYHTGGVPGRNEIDETQELYYPAIMKAIVNTGYKGHVAQEFIPIRADKLASLKQGITICDV